GSADTTRKLLQEEKDVKLVALPKNIGAAARNEGVIRADTPYIAFCDDDTYWEADGLRIAADMLDKYPALGLVNARIVVGDEEKPDPISEQMEDSPLSDEAGIPGKVLMSFMGGASMVRKDAWVEVGGYDRKMFIGGEEETVGWKLAKAGWEMRYVPEVVVHHYPTMQNAAGLQDYGIRNTIWNAWLHRPAKRAWGWTWHVISSSPKNRILLKGILKTLPGIPWVARNRDVMKPNVEAKVRRLELQRLEGDNARQYGRDLKRSGTQGASS
ncbi:MAG TPA: glycosyltransferase, partial [Candidatus Saccharimonadales bacterium]|nr:glycosyltransferase [Candidatus Saccharimonadales bacterium]